MRLIDADYLESKKYSYFSHESGKYRQVVFMGDVDNAPTIDAVPVVRCRECKNFGRNEENDTYCKSVNGLTDPDEDDFCSYGEPKEGTE